MYDRKTKEIELFGGCYLISERIIMDVQMLEMFREKHAEGNDSQTALQIVAMTVHDGLKINLDLIPKWNLLKRRRIKKVISIEFLLNHLSSSQLLEYFHEVRRLENPEYDVEMGEKKTEPMKTTNQNLTGS